MNNNLDLAAIIKLLTELYKLYKDGKLDVVYEQVVPVGTGRSGAQIAFKPITHVSFDADRGRVVLH